MVGNMELLENILLALLKRVFYNTPSVSEQPNQNNPKACLQIHQNKWPPFTIQSNDFHKLTV